MMMHIRKSPFITIKADLQRKEAFLFGKYKIAEKYFNPDTLYICMGNKRFSMKNKEQLRRDQYEKLYAQRFSIDTKEYVQFMVKEQFWRFMGKELDIENPKTFSEKLNWMKIFYHNPLMTVCADKVRVREFVREKVDGIDEHFIEQYGIYDNVDTVQFDSFPDSFVLKSNWGSGAQIIVKDKSLFDRESAKKMMRHWLRPESNHYFCAFEYGYKNILPKIVCEKFLDYEYKIEFFCFNGNPIYYWIVFNDKTNAVQANFYTLDGKKLNLVHKYPNFDCKIQHSEFFDELVSICKKLSSDFPFVRVDFYKTKESWKFCELTFVHWGGLMPFTPESFDLEFGNHLTLPNPCTRQDNEY